jgi:hypothetical protein
MASAFEGVKPFPGAASQASAAPIGHNKPPLDESVLIDFDQELRSIPGLVARIEQLIERGSAAGPCETEEMAGRYGDYAKMVRDAIQRIEGLRETHNRPLLNAQRALKAKSDGMVNKLQEAANRVRKHLDAFMAEQRRKAEEERRRAEEQARAAREAAEAEARRQAEEAGQDPDAVEIATTVEIAKPEVSEPVVHGDYGARVGSQTIWKHRIIGVRKLPDAILNHEKVIEAIDKVIAAQVRSGTRSIRGVEIFSEEKTVVR